MAAAGVLFASLWGESPESVELEANQSIVPPELLRQLGRVAWQVVQQYEQPNNFNDN